MYGSEAQLTALVDGLFKKSHQEEMFAQIKRALHRIPLTFTPKELATLLDDGPMFLKSSQACELQDILNAKVPALDYVFHHVICSRVLDYWNLVK
jgi:hypothetical protein